MGCASSCHTVDGRAMGLDDDQLSNCEKVESLLAKIFQTFIRSETEYNDNVVFKRARLTASNSIPNWLSKRTMASRSSSSRGAVVSSPLSPLLSLHGAQGSRPRAVGTAVATGTATASASTSRRSRLRARAKLQRKASKPIMDWSQRSPPARYWRVFHSNKGRAIV